MNILKLFFIVFILALCTMHVDGYGFNIGPFNFGGEGYSGGYTKDWSMQNMKVGSRSLCYAITQQKQVEIVVKQLEKVSANELKITLKKIVINPYVFGLTQNRQPVVRAQVVEEKVLKEVTVKYFDEGKDLQQKDGAIDNEDQQMGDVAKATTLPAKGETGEISIRQIRNIRVMEDSHFDAPKDFDKVFKDTMTRVFCQINAPSPAAK